MEQKPEDLRQALIFQPSLLSFESQRDYRQLANAIRDHISPQDILEEIWTSEIVEGEWEIVRLRRSKGQIVNLDKLVSLRNLLQLILPHASDAEIDDLTRLVHEQGDQETSHYAIGQRRSGRVSH